ncbi:hypothetical protein [Mucilaginibacter ginsenosidivorax]|uniref:hypothetical protein n=1 Tax=Mucilaginibacter ginsenosidivorax TaxID=862126 RepID=UPI001863C599|nr:hypothetical protein [Mucilaginibacter ginsenosidivorax]
MKLILNSALRGTATALSLFFLIPRWLKAVIHLTAYTNTYINLKTNDKYIIVLPGCLTLSLAINQFINSGRFKYLPTKPIFYEENFKLFFMHSCNPGIDKVH